RTSPTPGQPDKQPLVMPIAMGLLGQDGKDLPTRLAGEAAAQSGTRVLLLTKAEQRFTFTDVPERPVPSLLRAFSAPVKLAGISEDQLRFLATHDSDPFVRWDSGQQHAARCLLDMVAAVQRGEQPVTDPGLIDAARATLARSAEDPALAAEALLLPSEAFLADQMTIADVDAIHAARESARIAIRVALHGELRAFHERLTDTGPYRIDGPAIGRRSLRNAALGYLVAGGDVEGVRLAKAQFDTRQNMTDVLAALSMLAATDSAERNEALAAFHASRRGDALVLDKWFAIQAVSPLPDTPRAVRVLAKHPDFDLRNPNRVRALVSSFAAGNQVRFHDPSGTGYAFLADTIIALDPANAQVAARLVSPLGQWRRVDEARQALMQAELRRILDVPGLSRNTREMAGKSLAE
ncbi:MAG: DUF3458 domain-containing protein, partial [Acetobacteraceae bacterium]